jgi:hypothetical protein
MLREYEVLGGTTFAVIRDGARFHVVPVAALNAAGERVSQASILDTVVSVPAAQRDGGDLLQAICDDIQQKTGYKVGIGPSVPGNYLSRYKSNVGISKETTRSAIAHLLDRASAPGIFDWDLYYGPAEKAYMLNFGYVGPASQPAQ